jgi:hypothetical protein
MKIFDGFVEIEILPWYGGMNPAEHLDFSSRQSALFFVERFKPNQVAMHFLRRLLLERGCGLGLPITSDDEILGQVAQMLAAGELSATRTPLVLGSAAGSTRPCSRPQP